MIYKALIMALAILCGSISVVILLGTIVNLKREKFSKEDALVGFVLCILAVMLTVTFVAVVLS